MDDMERKNIQTQQKPVSIIIIIMLIVMRSYEPMMNILYATDGFCRLQAKSLTHHAFTLLYASWL